MIGPWLDHVMVQSWYNHGAIMVQSWNYFWPNHETSWPNHETTWTIFYYILVLWQTKNNRQTDTTVSHNWDMIGPWVGYEFSWLGYDWFMIGQWLGYDWTMTCYNHGPIMAPIMAQLWKTNCVVWCVLLLLVVLFFFFLVVFCVVVCSLWLLVRPRLVHD
jgi:hypothetical protein